MRNPHFSPITWLLPLLPLSLACLIYFSKFQTSSFLYINQFTQFLPDRLWAGLTFLGNGWGAFAIAFPLLLLAPRLLCAGIFAGIASAIASSSLKPLFDLPRPAGILLDGSFYRIGESLIHKAFPSGHTLTAFAVATALYFSVKQDKRTSLQWLFVVATLTGLSRIAVGAHWLTDVLAGAGIGFWCGLIGALIAQFVPEDQLRPNRIGPRLVAFGGAITAYVLLTQTMDIELNQPLQYACIGLIGITLVLFIKAQTPNTPNPSKAL